jgi:hypothetical protein
VAAGWRAGRSRSARRQRNLALRGSAYLQSPPVSRPGSWSCAAIAVIALSPVALARADGEQPGVIAWPPGPDWPPTTLLTERGRSPRYFSEPKAIQGIGLRPSLKGMGRIQPPPDYRSFTLAGDLHLVGRFGLGRGRSLGLWPELGYAISGTGGHYASAGLGLASQTPPGMRLSFGLVPRAVIGRREGELALGVRTSALLELYFDDGNAWGLELCHQFTRAGGIDLHELGAGITLIWLPRRWD